MKPPIKKFVVLFLVFSLATSSLALGASALIRRSSINKTTAEAEKNRVAEITPANYQLYGAGPDGKNITEEMTSLFARQLVVMNPYGPLVQDGMIHLLSPTSTELVSYLDTNPPSEDLLTQPIDESRIQILESPTQGDISGYLSAVTEIQSALSSNQVWQNGPSYRVVSSVEEVSEWTNESWNALTKARDEMYALKVPAPLLAIHKSQLNFFSTISSFSGLVASDPIGAVALTDRMDAIVAEQIQNTENIILDLQNDFSELSLSLPVESRSVLAQILGVQVAHATLPTIDWAALGQWIIKFYKEYAKEMKAYALGFLKNTIIQKVSSKIIEWAQGEGVPGYVTNWLAFQANAQLNVAFGTISRETAKVCGNAATTGLYGDILSSALGVSNYQAGVTGVRQTVGETPGCPPASSPIYTGQGPYTAQNFLQSLEYNPYADLLRIRSQATRAAGAASQAAVNEALSGRGSLDIKKCDDGTAVDHEGLCGDGTAAQTITPGSAKQDLISRGLAATLDTISSANNESMYASIAQILTSAVLSYVIKEGSGVFERSGRGGTTPPPQPGPDGSVTASINWYADQLDTALALANGAVQHSGQAVRTFQQILETGSCAEAVADEVRANIAAINGGMSTLTARVQEIQTLINAVAALRQNGQATQADLNRIGTTASITSIVTRSQADNDAAMTLLNAANDLFLSPDCAPS